MLKKFNVVIKNFNVVIKKFNVVIKVSSFVIVGNPEYKKQQNPYW